MAQAPPDLTVMLGAAKAAWDALQKLLDAQPGASGEWKFYGAKHGWQRKVTADKVALVYLIPKAGYFTAAVALRDDAIAALRGRGYPVDRVREIETARASTEGKPARVEVRTLKDVALVEILVMTKLATRASRTRVRATKR
jgi:hypothetical protein